MVPQLSKRALILQESAIRKLDLVVAQQTDTEFLRLNIGQPDVPTPQPMLDALKNDGTSLPSLHSPFWAPDAEKVIATGAEALASSAIDLMPRTGS